MKNFQAYYLLKAGNKKFAVSQVDIAAKNGLVINAITNHIPSHATPPIEPDSAGGWLKLLSHSSIPVTNIAAIAPMNSPTTQAR
ncbi:hypothetical protein BV378_22650 [Nostoc sp. RF31YmG]|nr:hypothetical protein BV378_22650 [Nostoc sp. RF31YmG]